ncbi:MAG: type I-E CRISPR-associated protein Cas6/Cse3/CasE [Verrucomicrobiales bacterium]|nr:type I-E CRISPR-associated protein Cas6/Cse3/CasE [Verrucomicrobiales bacterium]
MNLHLTEIRLGYDTAAKAGLRDSYLWHQKIWLCFPGRESAPRDFLTRLDPLDDHLRLLMVSVAPPRRPPWCPVEGWRTKPVPDAFLAVGAFRFSLVANPTRKLVVRDDAGIRKKNGRRVPILHRDDREDPLTGRLEPGLLSWLARKGLDHGFSFDPGLVRTVPRPRQPFIKGGVAGMHAGIEFQGQLRVTQPESFQKAFAEGVGSAKAFGFGMLVLAPLEPLPLSTTQVPSSPLP